jgi:hypothetical protein
MDPINLFYSEPDPDRWFPFDRYPRRLLRRILRGKPCVGGQQRVFLNLCLGLQKLGIPFRVNDYTYARKHQDALCCILGKKHVLDSFKLPNPIMVGPCVHDHPVEDPDLFQKHTVKRILVPGPWMELMCKPYWGDLVAAWPAGIDTDEWNSSERAGLPNDILLYNKLRWKQYPQHYIMLQEIRNSLTRLGLRYRELTYGQYSPQEYSDSLHQSRAMIFVCEYESQGLACAEALSSGVPVLAWEGSKQWIDPQYYPNKVRFEPVSAVPYWDPRCGEVFTGKDDFDEVLVKFLTKLASAYDPRSFILDNFTLEKSARSFLDHLSTAFQHA